MTSVLVDKLINHVLSLRFAVTNAQLERTGLIRAPIHRPLQESWNTFLWSHEARVVLVDFEQTDMQFLESAEKIFRQHERALDDLRWRNYSYIAQRYDWGAMSARKHREQRTYEQDLSVFLLFFWREFQFSRGFSGQQKGNAGCECIMPIISLAG